MTDVGVVLDLMTHDIDLILNFVRSAVRAVHASQNPCGYSSYGTRCPKNRFECYGTDKAGFQKFLV